MAWAPHITVATIIERDGQFLFVEEMSSGERVLNQPAGHLEANESLIEAAVRETLEETGWHVEVTGVTGIYLYTAPSNGVTYQRVCFAAKAIRHDPSLTLDEGIIGPLWLNRCELEEHKSRWRSELVAQCVDDYLKGPVFDLSLIRN